MGLRVPRKGFSLIPNSLMKLFSHFLSSAPALLLLATLFLPTGCSRPKDRFVFEGNIANIQQGEFYVYCDDGTFDGVDTIRIDGGSFSYERTLTTPTVLTLLYPNFSQTYIVAEPGEVVTMEGDASKLGEADISGTEENKLLTEFRQKNASASENEARRAAADFIHTHTPMLAAVALFKRYFAYDKTPDPSTTLTLLDDLLKAQPQNPTLAMLDNHLRPVLTTAAGQKLPQFAFATLKGDSVRSTEFAGKPLVVAFWATWNNECTDLYAALRRIGRDYKGRVGMLNVSLDDDKRLCRNRIQRDSLVNVVYDGKGLDSPSARRLGMRYVPGNLLVDAEGKIVARDLAPDDLEKQLRALVKE